MNNTLERLIMLQIEIIGILCLIGFAVYKINRVFNTINATTKNHQEWIQFSLQSSLKKDLEAQPKEQDVKE